ncbi:MAG: hypothetical protein KBB32_06105 [Spirochaetia bacterium]|nr:hypothetical protein [Spirochaetia bacterium]
MAENADKKGWRTILLGGALAVAGALGVWTLARVTPDGKGPLTVDTAAARFQDSFDKALPFRGGAAELWARARWALFGQGYRGVVVGTDGWLFTAEEFQDDPGLSVADPVAAAAAYQRRLSEAGMTLVIALVPSKSRVYAGNLPSGAPWPRRYEAALEAFGRAGVPAVDLRPAMDPTAAGGDTFLRTDTHWSPLGAHRAAESVRAYLGSAGLAPEPEASFSVARGSDAPYPGDLLAYLPERGAFFRALPEPDTLPESIWTEGGPAAFDLASALFGAQVLPVALVGTSYTASARWGFEAFLQAELGVGTLNLAAEGSGPFTPMDQALGGGALEANGVRLVLWEVPERYLPVSSLRADDQPRF